MQSLKDIKDECKDCGELFTCELCKDGHGIKRERSRMTEMLRCQLKHMEEREKQNNEH